MVNVGGVNIITDVRGWFAQLRAAKRVSAQLTRLEAIRKNQVNFAPEKAAEALAELKALVAEPAIDQGVKKLAGDILKQIEALAQQAPQPAPGQHRPKPPAPPKPGQPKGPTPPKPPAQQQPQQPTQPPQPQMLSLTVDAKTPIARISKGDVGTVVGSSFAAVCLAGARSSQEDSLLIAQAGDNLLLVITDGAGGHAAGEVASHTAIIAFDEAFKADPNNFSFDDRLVDPSKPYDASANPVAAYGPIGRAHIEILQLNQGKSGTNEMITTAAAALIRGNQLTCRNVGDSRIYVYNPAQKQLRLCSLDDNEGMVAVGIFDKRKNGEMLTEDESRTFHDHTYTAKPNPIYMIGSSQNSYVNYPAVQHTLANGELVIVCGDGIHDFMPFDEMKAVIEGGLAANPNALPLEIAQALQARAFENMARLWVEKLVSRQLNVLLTAKQQAGEQATSVDAAQALAATVFKNILQQYPEAEIQTDITNVIATAPQNPVDAIAGALMIKAFDLLNKFDPQTADPRQKQYGDNTTVIVNRYVDLSAAGEDMPTVRKSLDLSAIKMRDDQAKLGTQQKRDTLTQEAAQLNANATQFSSELVQERTRLVTERNRVIGALNEQASDLDTHTKVASRLKAFVDKRRKHIEEQIAQTERKAQTALNTEEIRDVDARMRGANPKLPNFASIQGALDSLKESARRPYENTLQNLRLQLADLANQETLITSEQKTAADIKRYMGTLENLAEQLNQQIGGINVELNDLVQQLLGQAQRLQVIANAIIKVLGEKK
ncbi:MAG: protein phosphatase 2C domain-containing protein [Candidatus Margulisbacteria bacterium]|nr:protein phosphatase 2C domain-containing protein [Candidatus Margulisiibacteriota bacterium]